MLTNVGRVRMSKNKKEGRENFEKIIENRCKVSKIEIRILI
jgi:hypothetical protein